MYFYDTMTNNKCLNHIDLKIFSHMKDWLFSFTSLSQLFQLTEMGFSEGGAILENPMKITWHTSKQNLESLTCGSCEASTHTRQAGVVR